MTEQEIIIINLKKSLKKCISKWEEKYAQKAF